MLRINNSNYRNNPGVPGGSQEEIWNRLCYIIEEAAPKSIEDISSVSPIFWMEFYDLLHRLVPNMDKATDEILGEMIDNCRWNDLVALLNTFLVR